MSLRREKKRWFLAVRMMGETTLVKESHQTDRLPGDTGGTIAAMGDNDLGVKLFIIKPI